MLIIEISGGTLASKQESWGLLSSSGFGHSSLFPYTIEERHSLRPAKKGVLAVLPTVGHRGGEEFHIKEVVAAQCALHLFHHASAIFHDF